MLHPIFEEASNIVREEFPGTHQVVFARVDCDQHCESIFFILTLPTSAVINPILLDQHVFDYNGIMILVASYGVYTFLYKVSSCFRFHLMPQMTER